MNRKPAILAAAFAVFAFTTQGAQAHKIKKPIKAVAIGVGIGSGAVMRAAGGRRLAGERGL
jgi:hypothetical protein